VKKDGTPIILLSFTRTILLADLLLAILIELICFFLNLRTFTAYGTVLTWVGNALIIFACITGIGGFASRAQDATAFSRSGAGNMFENLQRISDARSSNLGCFLHLFFAGLLLMGIGYFVETIPFLF